jgi:hypothetical protein
MIHILYPALVSNSSRRDAGIKSLAIMSETTIQFGRLNLQTEMTQPQQTRQLR